MRREKISERMKLLQALVPGCDKVKKMFFVFTLSLFNLYFIITAAAVVLCVCVYGMCLYGLL